MKSFQHNANLLLNSGSASHSILESAELYNVLTSELPRIILREFEYNLGDVPQARPRKRDRVLAKAIDIIEASSHEMPRIGQLCKSVGVSERTLEYAFLERYQLTPKSYINATLLNKVNKELARNKDQMISEIATKYGFWHMGQFAADFKKQFGILPSSIFNKA